MYCLFHYENILSAHCKATSYLTSSEITLQSLPSHIGITHKIRQGEAIFNHHGQKIRGIQVLRVTRSEACVQHWKSKSHILLTSLRGQIQAS